MLFILKGTKWLERGRWLEWVRDKISVLKVGDVTKKSLETYGAHNQVKEKNKIMSQTTVNV